jgi:hypothetical protein
MSIFSLATSSPIASMLLRFNPVKDDNLFMLNGGNKIKRRSISIYGITYLVIKACIYTA